MVMGLHNICTVSTSAELLDVVAFDCIFINIYFYKVLYCTYFIFTLSENLNLQILLGKLATYSHVSGPVSRSNSMCTVYVGLGGRVGWGGNSELLTAFSYITTTTPPGTRE